MKNTIYSLPQHLLGKDIYTKNGKTELNEKTTQKELENLYELCGIVEINKYEYELPDKPPKFSKGKKTDV